MAEAQTDVDVVDTLTMSDILVMTVEELRSELDKRDKLPEGTANKPELQMALLNSISAPITPKMSRPAPSYPVAAPTQSVRFDSSRDIWGQSKKPSPVRAPAELSSGSTDLQFQLRRLELEERRLEAEREREERRERREAEEREREREREREERARQHELQMKCLELGLQLPAPVAEGRPHAPTFRVDTATKLIPKFNEHDIESFLLSFEKIAQLNGFPEDKYAAVLQAHLTGKALRVFTELSVEECQDYPTLKAALLTAYAVVPEVYRKRFRNLTKHHSETFSEYAFRLSVQFRRWLESEGAYDDV